MSDPPKPPTDSDRTSPPNDSPAGGTVDGIAPDKNSTSGGSKSDEGAEPPAPDKTNAYSDPSLKAGVSPSPSANGTSADIVNKAKGIASKGVQQGESWAKANPGAIVAIGASNKHSVVVGADAAQCSWGAC